MIDTPSSRVPGRRPWLGRFTASIETGGRIVLTGELVDDALDTLRTALDLALLESEERILIDVSQLWWIEPTAVSELLRYQLLALAHHRRFCLKNASPAVTRALDLFDLVPILMCGHRHDTESLELPEIVLR